MKNLILFFAVLISYHQGWGQDSITRSNYTPTYEEAIRFYKMLDEKYESAELLTMGKTDVGEPLHVLLIDETQQFNPRNKSQVTILINNGIHPGEPCGINASMLLAEKLLQSGELDPGIVLAIIPIYNVGGALNRSCCSRANQNGPLEYGFRGNAQNYDLNRDFIKMDSDNAFAFAKIFQYLNPDVFVDTHASNGADYQYTMTLLPTQPDKLGGQLGALLRDKFNPYLFDQMEQTQYGLVPYVNVFGKGLEHGIPGFYDSPRYASGYTTLFHTIGFTTEAHMWKPFDDRVASTKILIENIIQFSTDNRKEILSARANDLADHSSFQYLNWKRTNDTTELLDFRGYELMYPVSEVTGAQQLKYDRTKPDTFQLAYFNHFVPIDSVRVPEFYYLPQAWYKTLRRLSANDVMYKKVGADTTLLVEVYYIEDYTTKKAPYEGHYLHSNTAITVDTQQIVLRKGDWIIPTNQSNRRFIIEVLEPTAVDSYFNWNMFDAMLQQKEWFSDYIFDDMAYKMLEYDSALNAQFQAERKLHPEWEEDSYAALYWIYKRSPYYEQSHNRYPVFRSLH